MTKLGFAGELGHLADPLTIVARRPDGTGVSEVANSLHRTLSGWFPTRWLDISGSLTPARVSRTLESKGTVIVCELPRHQPDLWSALSRRKSGVVRGFYTWDSSEIPPTHLALLRTFDQVVVPSVSLARTLSEFGIEATRLPIALDLRPFDLLASVRKVQERSNTFRIISLGAFHPRKNHNVTISAVLALLAKGIDVRLHIHSNLRQSDPSQLLLQVPKRFHERFVVTSEHLSIRGLQRLLLDADLLVSASGGETFNIGARQALATGLRIAVTRVVGHEDLHELPGVQTVAAPIPVPAVYPEEHGGVYGIQYIPRAEDLTSVLEDCIFTTSDQPQEIARAAWRWDFRSLKHTYRNTILNDLARSPVTKGVARPREDIVMVGHDGGFFSLFNTFISAKRYWENGSAFQRVIPDWSVESIKRFWNIDSFDSFCYAQPDDGNVFPLLFLGPDNVSESELKSVTSWDHRVKRVHTFNGFADPFLTYVNAAKLYRSRGFSSWRSDMNQITRQISPHAHVLQRVAECFRGVPTDALVIGVHVRHPSHAVEQPDKKIPLATDFIQVCLARLREEELLNPGRPLRVFLATDQDVVTKQFSSELGERLLMLPDVQRVSVADDLRFAEASEGSQLVQGHQVQHLAAADSARWNKQLAEEVIADVWALARSSEFFHTVSNVATAVSMLNPLSKMLLVNSGDSLEIARLRASLQSSTCLL